MHEHLKFYNNAHLMKEEDTAWRWSPFYQTFLRDFPKIGPQRPWQHTEEEWVYIVKALQVEGARHNVYLKEQDIMRRPKDIASPALVVGNLGYGGFSRTPQDVAYEVDLTGLALAIIPIRSLTFEPTDGNGITNDQEFAVTTRTNTIVSEDGLSQLGESACKTTESKDNR